jgi:hypothetical protein
MQIQAYSAADDFGGGWVESVKGTVRPDWICMTVVPLDKPRKGHQLLKVFNFLFLILNI